MQRSLLVAILSHLLAFGPAAFGQFGDVTIEISHHDGHPEQMLSKNIANEIIYQIVVDRFYDGNPDNNCLHNGNFCARGEPDDWFRYQGGDLRGVIEKLPYLANLGISRIWLTPIFENQLVTAMEDRPQGLSEVFSYHGYWIKDWYRLNPYFTDYGRRDYDIVDELIGRARKLGLQIYLDSVVNHTSPLKPTQWSLDYVNSLDPPECVNCDPIGALYHDGKYLSGITEDRFLAATQPAYQRRYHDCGRSIGDWQGDWENPDIVETCNLMGLADLNQDSELISQYLIKAHKFWLNRGIAGYRMDTVKHVNQKFWKRFSNEMYSYQGEVEIFGEYYGGGPLAADSYDYYRKTRMSMIDFDFRKALRKVFLYPNQSSFSEIVRVWQNDFRLKDARSLITYLDSHDHKRLRGESPGISMNRLKQAISLWLVSRGVPVIYYGLEQDLFFPNEPGDPYNRPMMKSFDQSHQLYHQIRLLNKLRRRNLALRYGKTRIIHLTKHIIAFERVYSSDRILFVTSKNPRQGSDVFSIKNVSLPAGVYRDVLSNRRYEIKASQLPVRLADGDVILLESN